MERPDVRAPLVCHVIDTLEGGGTERMLVRLLHAFDRALARHAVISLRRAGALASGLPSDVACLPLDLPGRSPLAWWTLARRLRALRPSLLHARGVGCWIDALVASRLVRGCRVLLGFHGTDHGGDLRTADLAKVRIARGLGARFATVSHAGADILTRQAGVSTERIAVLPNGVDRAAFQAGPAARPRRRAELGLPDDAVLAGTIGSLTPVKGPEHLFEAFTRAAPLAPRLHLLFVGNGPLLGELTLAASRAGLTKRTHFIPANGQVADWLAAIDLYVCASHSEGLSNALLEALAAGKPVITTDVGDHARVIRDGREGRVVAARDPDPLTFALLEAACRPDLRAAMSSAASRRAEDFAFDASVRRYDGLYAELLRGDGGVVAPVVGAGSVAAVR